MTRHRPGGEGSRVSSSSSSISTSSSSAVPRTYSRGVRLRRYALTDYPEGLSQGFRLRAVAYGGYLMPSAVFLYRRDLLGAAQEASDRLVGVCSPADLEEFPEGQPEEGALPAYFRDTELDIVCRSRHQADAAWALIHREVEVLVESLDVMDVLGAPEDYAVGSPPDATPESSSSSE